MQVRGGKKYIARAIYHHDRLFSDQLVEDEEYYVLKKTLSISILNFVLLSEEDDLHNVCVMVILTTSQKVYQSVSGRH